MIIDVHDPQIHDARALEQRIDSIAGVVTNAFAMRGAEFFCWGPLTV